MADQDNQVNGQDAINDETTPTTPTTEITIGQVLTTEGDASAAPKGKKKKKERTPEQKKRRRIVGWSITGGILGAIALCVALFAILNAVTTKALMEQAKAFEAVTYTLHDQLTPTLDENGYPQTDADGFYSFTTDRAFNVMHITDVHIGSGVVCQQKDTWAMNAVANMARKSQPDLIVVTGDIGYPVPFSSGSFNNLNAIKVFANEMESLGVYWVFTFGNHDTEAYSYYTRKQISDWFVDQHFKYCLYQPNNDFSDKKEAEDFGYGNGIIKVKNSAGAITQAIVLLDSHSYTGGDFMGFLWKYDNIHASQINWYKQSMEKLYAENNYAPVKNLAFCHIPWREYREAWKELADHNAEIGNSGTPEDSEHVRYVYGANGEITGATVNPFATTSEDTYGVFCGIKDESVAGLMWQAAKENNMQGVFCGHDHINNFSVEYTKDDYTMRLTYGLSVDYLAYAGIFKQHSQRGCTAITINPDGSFACAQRNYYKDFDMAPEAGSLDD
jgi:hypothetical protein